MRVSTGASAALVLGMLSLALPGCVPGAIGDAGGGGGSVDGDESALDEASGPSGSGGAGSFASGSGTPGSGTTGSDTSGSYTGGSESSGGESSGGESSGSLASGSGGSDGAAGSGGSDSGDGASGAGGAPSETAGSGGAPGEPTTAGAGGDDGSTSAATSGGGPPAPFCGDGTCDAAETCESCASDCGACDECVGASDATTMLDAEEQAFLVLINDYRAANGRGPLTACTSLNRAAQAHSEDMRDESYFSHTGLDGSRFWNRACDACYERGCGPTTPMAENIAAGNTGAAGTFEQWRNSPGHNTNMLGSYTQIGIGRATGGGTYGTYWTNVFAAADEPSCN